MKQILYIITIDEVYDFQGFSHKPQVFKEKTDAMKILRELRENAKAEFADECNDEDDWDEETSESFSIYPEGEWGTTHYDARIDEVEVEL